jgi:hypothetical protein
MHGTAIAVRTLCPTSKDDGLVAAQRDQQGSAHGLVHLV